MLRRLPESTHLANRDNIQVSRWADMVARLFGLKGGDTLPRTGRELTPTIVLESDRPEWRRAAGARIGAGNVSVPAGGAGVRSGAQLWNPPDSGCIVVVTDFWWSGGAGGACQIGFSRTALANDANATVHRDLRNAVNSGGNLGFACSIRSEQTPGSKILTDHWEALHLANTPYHVQLPMVLPPGFGAVMQPTTDNVEIRACFMWEERPRDSTADA